MTSGQQSTRFLAGTLIATFVLAVMAATPAIGQEKAKAAKAEKGKAITTLVVENEKVRVQEVRFRPGDVNEAVPSSSMRVVHALKGGTLVRTYADGKTDKVEWKTGQTRINPPSAQAYTAKYNGKKELVLYVVVLK